MLSFDSDCCLSVNWRTGAEVHLVLSASNRCVSFLYLAIGLQLSLDCLEKRFWAIAKQVSSPNPCRTSLWGFYIFLDWVKTLLISLHTLNFIDWGKFTVLNTIVSFELQTFIRPNGSAVDTLCVVVYNWLSGQICQCQFGAVACAPLWHKKELLETSFLTYSHLFQGDLL